MSSEQSQETLHQVSLNTHSFIQLLTIPLNKISVYSSCFLFRLVLDGVWSVLPSLSQRNTGVMRPGRICPSTTDILQLLYYKYEVIRERLYREMLQDEYGNRYSEFINAPFHRIVEQYLFTHHYRCCLVGLDVSVGSDRMCVWTRSVCRAGFQTQRLASGVWASRGPPVLQVLLVICASVRCWFLSLPLYIWYINVLMRYTF